ncbi:MAG: ATP-binding protein [Micrococcales bacterium]|nr:ATP-binding protein [Micrococcales bacterium]
MLVNGARQCGKTTLVAQLARERGAQWFSFDRADTLQAARHDPTTFVRAANPMVIDEVQRVPQILLAIKEAVDGDYNPGRFLLTGSARLLGLRSVPDVLPGRMETVELWPLSQGEIDDAPDGFVDAVFRDGPTVRHDSDEDRDGYLRRIVRGGFPGAVAREGRRRTRFLESYVADLVNRDVLQVAAIEKGDRMRSLITLLAGRCGQVVSATALASALGVSKQTVDRYLAILQEVFLVKLLPAYSRSTTARATRAPKLAFVDSGLAAVLVGHDETSLHKVTSPLGGLLESFVAMEIARQLTWASQTVDLFHYRTRDGVEVDLVLADRRGQVVAVEVKASATASPDDFRGVRHLRERLGDDLRVGVVLYLGQQTLSFGDRLVALPVSALWHLS